MASFPTDAEQVVMRILQSEPKGLYGLQIVEQSRGVIKRGSVYVLLGRLEKKGFVEAARLPAARNHSGLVRPIYQLSAEGVRTLSFIRTQRERLAGTFA